MEVEKTFHPAWLEKDHPNYFRWERGRKLSGERADFVFRLLHLNNIRTGGIKVLDLGSGEGGTSALFSKNNFAVSFDISLIRLVRQDKYKLINKIKGDAEFLPFKSNSFDLIIMQDVIEHIDEPKKIIHEIKRILKKEGNIFLSTPNKFSVFNVLADPHWGLPLLSLFDRYRIKKYFLKYFRKNETGRSDIAELFSLSGLKKLFTEEFEQKLCTKESVQLLFNGNKGIVWSNFHLRFIKLIKFLKLSKAIEKISNNDYGILNYFFTPTFYLILNRKLESREF